MKETWRFIIIFLLSIGFLFFLSSSAWAGIEHNIRGEAYTEQGDFIYFNCLDQPIDSFPYLFPFPLGGNPCAIKYPGLGGAEIDNYGVHLDFNDYTFDGYARHEVHGLISFRHGIPFDATYDFLDNCSKTDASVCGAINNCSACYDGAYDYQLDSNRSQRVYGWAYVVGSGQWIRLDSQDIVEADRFGIFNFSSADRAGEFFAYFSHDVWGKIDLNCQWPGPPSCSPDYKVYVGKLELAEMSAPNWGATEACSSGALGAIFEWKVHGGEVDQYTIRINHVNDINTAYEFNLAEGALGFNGFQSRIGESGFNYTLNYDTSYYWWLKAYHNAYEDPVETNWIQFDHNLAADPVDGVQGVLTDNKEHNNTKSSEPNLTFTTYKHEWPSPHFSWEAYPTHEFQAGTANRFYVIGDTEDKEGTQEDKEGTHYWLNPFLKISFGTPEFLIDEFKWWGIPEDKISIYNAAILPAVATDLVLHLDATSITGLVDGAKVAQWDDDSINNYHVSQLSEDKQPLYIINAIDGRPAVRFDGSSSQLINQIFSVTQPFTIFTVARSSHKLADAYILDSSIAEGAALGYDEESKWLMWAGTALAGGSTNHNLSLWTAFYHGDNSFLRVNQGGVDIVDLSGAVGGQNKDGIIIGSNYDNNHYWQGDIAEILIFDGELTPPDRQKVENYLAEKWGIIDPLEPTASQVDVYFESVEPDQTIWLELEDKEGYACSISSPPFTISYELPLWREIKAR